MTLQLKEQKMETLHQQIDKVARKTYGQVNRMFPKQLPILEKDEAEKAYKKLIAKFGTKQVWSEYSNKWITKKMKVRRIRKFGEKTFKTEVRKCWLSLNGDTNTLHKGWRRLVHDVSHYVHDFRFPDSSNHDLAQAVIEKEMVNYVINQGWLEGKLKTKLKPKLTKDEKQNAKIISLEKLIKSWETKEKRAKTYIKKYKTKLRRLKIRLAD
jgi:hypothetical protein|tara:strand:- start:442 stop:1074 length:633 start_codon:yes stop_codon:yes gene_type:complete